MVYLATGMVTALVLAYKSEKKGSVSPFLIFGGDIIGLAISFIFWPLIAIISVMELNFSDEKKEEAKEDRKESIIGKIGVTQTLMHLSGRVVVDNVFIDAYSVSGSLGIGESVEILSKKMNYYKVRKVEQDGGLNS